MQSVYILIALSGLDYITGVVRAIFEKRLASSIGYKGILRKAMMFGVVGGSFVLDSIINGGVSAMVCTFYTANEMLSILENAVACGIPCPEALKKALKILHDKGGE